MANHCLKTLCLIALVMVGGAVRAEDESPPSSCMIFVDDMATMDARMANGYFNWAHTHMQRHERWGRGGDEPARDLAFSDEEAISHFETLLAYCRDNPDKQLVDSVMALYRSLPVAE